MSMTLMARAMAIKTNDCLPSGVVESTKLILTDDVKARYWQS
ncbi:hypothetical protein MJM25_27430 [Salmonella enterica subsp. enterica serovar Lubbock]|nr:hypothetical protein [Salmonella enterica subsp. enterica serovar Lubbock]